MSNQDYTTPEKLRSQANLTRLLIESAVLKRLYAKHEEYKAEVAEAFSPGDSVKVKNAQGLEMGSVSVTSPSMKAVCKDDAVLLALAYEKGMELIDALPKAGTAKYAEAVDFLFENAPHLLDTGLSSADAKTLSEEVLEQWQIDGELPTSWEVTEASKPSFRVTPGRTKPAKAAIEHLADQMTEILHEAPKEIEK